MGRAVVFNIKNFELFGHKFLETLKILYLSIWRHRQVVPIMLKSSSKQMVQIENLSELYLNGQGSSL